jgi:hypothetical protein
LGELYKISVKIAITQVIEKRKEIESPEVRGRKMWSFLDFWMFIPLSRFWDEKRDDSRVAMVDFLSKEDSSDTPGALFFKLTLLRPPCLWLPFPKHSVNSKML